jgi:hypothetical protein
MDSVSQFHQYFNDFYGVDGIYSSGQHISKVTIMDAIGKHQTSNPDYIFIGDSIDRELVRDLIFTKDQLDAMYNAPKQGYYISAQDIKDLAVKN